MKRGKWIAHQLHRTINSGGKYWVLICEDHGFKPPECIHMRMPSSEYFMLKDMNGIDMEKYFTGLANRLNAN